MTKKKLAIFYLFMMTFGPVYAMLNFTFINQPKETLNTTDQNKITPSSITSNTNLLTGDRSITDSIEASQAWINDPGYWWDVSWEYRKKVTVTSSIAISNWPVTITVDFNPPAYKYSVRVIDSSGNEIPSQLSDIVYVNNTHIASANISFLVTFSDAGSQEYYIYWKTEYTDPPTYTKSLTVQTQDTIDGTKYIISSVNRGWSIEFGPTMGGLPTNITIGSSTIGEAPKVHFGVSLNGSIAYDDYLGQAYITESNWYGIPEYEDSLIYGYYLGVIFVPYKIINAKVYKDAELIAKANITYMIYDFGVIVSEKVKFETSLSNTEVYISGWTFDQDDEEGYNFDMLYTSSDLVDISVSQYPERSDSVLVSWHSYGSYSKRIYMQDANGVWRPSIGVARIYLTAGEHNITVWADGYSDSNFLSPDDYVFRLLDENGNFIQFVSVVDGGVYRYYRGYETYGIGDNGYVVFSYGQWVKVKVNVPTSGYYMLFFDSFDDDYAGDQKTTFTYYVDDNLIGSAITYCWKINVAYPQEDPTDDGYIYPRASVKLYDLYISPESVGLEYEVVLSWSSTNDLDLMVLKPDSNVVGANISSVGNEAKIVFTPYSAGHYTILVHNYEGDSTTFTLDITVKGGPEFVDVDDEGDWSFVAFYHSTKPIGIGLVKLEEDLSSIVWLSKNYIYHNEGNDSEDDYIFWARDISGVQVAVGDSIYERYGIIVWQPSGTGEARHTEFDTYRQYLSFSPVGAVSATVERFKIQVTIQLLDAYNAPIYGANVTVMNGTTLIAQGITDHSGMVLFDLFRYNYTLVLEVPMLNATYRKTITANYSIYDYDVHTNTTTMQFVDLVRLRVHVDSNTLVPYDVQNAEVILSNATTTLKGYTNLTGWLIAYLSIESWTIKINATVTGPPDSWDTIDVYSDADKTNLVGSGTEVSLDLTTVRDYWIVDIDLSTKKTGTELYLVGTPYTIEKTWGDNVSVIVGLREIENNTNINGTITWYVKQGETVILTGSGDVTETELYAFQFNTSLLRADSTYLLVIDGTPKDETRYLIPTPVTITLIVDPKPATLFVEYQPSDTIYWNESLTVLVRYVSGTQFIEGATVSVILQSGENVVSYNNLPMMGGYYVLTIDPFTYPTGTYTIKVRAEKENYTTTEVIDQLNILDRRTSVITPGIISIAWEEKESFLVTYVDTVEEEKTISGAEVTAVLKEAETDTIIAPLTVTETSGAYKVNIDLAGLNLDEGDYYIEINVGKKYFENRTVTVGFNVYERRTHATLSSTGISVYHGDVVRVKIFYYDDEATTEKLIDNADIKYAYITTETGEGGFMVDLVDLDNGTYLLELNTSELDLGTYLFTVYLDKEHYEDATAFSTLRVNAIPTTLYVTPSNKLETVWGSIAEFHVFFINIKEEGTVISDATVTMIIYKGGEIVNLTKFKDYNLTIGQDGSFVLSIDTSKLDSNTTYRIAITLSKDYYVSQSVDLYLTVKPLELEMDVDTDTQVYKNPVTGSAQTDIQVTLKDKNGVPISGANVSVEVYLNNTLVMKVQAQETYPGVYVATIDWSKLEAGYYYKVVVKVEKVSKDGVVIPAEHLSYKVAEISIFVDYPLGGSIRLFGRSLPVIIVIPLIILGAVGAGFIGYRYYSWIKLPPEVKELLKLIDQIKKDIYEYQAPSREEIFKEILLEALKSPKLGQ